MQTLFQQLLAGLQNGCIYAILALALVIVYQSTHLVNFAQGEMAMFSTYIAWTFINAGYGYWSAFLLTCGISFIVGSVVEKLIVRPVSQKGGELPVVIVFVGLLLIFNSIAGWIWSHTVKTFPAPFEQQAFGAHGVYSADILGAIAVTLVVLGLVYVFLRHTRMGLSMRAVAQNMESSQLAGINVDRILSIGWGLAALIGSVAGMISAPKLFLEPNMMSGVLIYAFAGALLGGINNAWGAVLGGLIVGVLENLLGTYVIGTELKLTVGLVLIILILLLRPSGLFGTAVVRRV
jgi:branched-chain amino acid transport system permease protein